MWLVWRRSEELREQKLIESKVHLRQVTHEEKIYIMIRDSDQENMLQEK